MVFHQQFCLAFGFARFIGVLIEHFAGAFPTWLAPEAVRVMLGSAAAREEKTAEALTVLREAGDPRAFPPARLRYTEGDDDGSRRRRLVPSQAASRVQAAARGWAVRLAAAGALQVADDAPGAGAAANLPPVCESKCA